MKALLLVLALTGCATDQPLVQLCAMQVVGQQSGIAIVRLSCEAEGERI